MMGLDRAAWIRYIALLLGSLLFVAVPLRHYSVILAGASDFRTVYSSARCLLDGCNPYSAAAIKRPLLRRMGGWVLNPRLVRERGDRSTRTIHQVRWLW
jgi:hypothetical protein